MPKPPGADKRRGRELRRVNSVRYPLYRRGRGETIRFLRGNFRRLRGIGERSGRPLGAEQAQDFGHAPGLGEAAFGPEGRGRLEDLVESAGAIDGELALQRGEQ